MNVCVACGNAAVFYVVRSSEKEPEVFSWRGPRGGYTMMWCVECWEFKDEPDWPKCDCGRPVIPGYESCHHCGAPMQRVIEQRRFETYPAWI